jgi:hypothetical protein
LDDLLDEQIAYYRARAPEYDRMLLRERRYDVDGLDPASPDRDTRELAIVEARLSGPSRTAADSGWSRFTTAPRNSSSS